MECNIYFVLVDQKLPSLPTDGIAKDLMLKQHFCQEGAAIQTRLLEMRLPCR
jgi:hypothetical protein